MATAATPATTAATSITTTTPAISSHSYHRGDPLDIPLIDHHLLTQLLLPRVVSAIRLALPQIHLDWTTGGGPSGRHHMGALNGSRKNSLLWKRILEGILRTCLILGSCRRIISYGSRRRRVDVSSGVNSNNSIHKQRANNQEISVATPAMRSFGVSIRTDSSEGGGSIIQQYGKVMALVFTVVVPSCYEELKHRRERQLDDQDRRLRLEEIRREFRSSMMHGASVTSTAYLANDTVGDHHDSRSHQESTSPTSIERQRQQQLLLISQRAYKRKSLLFSLIADAILGMGEILYPPLQLFNYLMYLWGMSSTPDLGMRVAGWEYCHDPFSSVILSTRNGGGGGDNNNSVISYDNYGEVVEHHQPHGGCFHQRHANFQYGHRRLLVEEALHAASLILPPRTNNAGSSGGSVGNVVVAADTPRGANRRINERPGDERRWMSTERSVEGEERYSPRRDMRLRMNSMAALNTGVNRYGLMRKRILSFLGVVEDDESNNDGLTSSSQNNRYSLTCSLCHVINPAIPYIASCGHCYCYICLRVAVTDNLSFRCVDCGQTIISSGRPCIHKESNKTWQG
ncbi:hypothetical protein ACHAW5_007274 [Stephanodiscus triporus]|uniref:Peroxin-2 n=1 Tax=Stephanodiscus triporus TaxID=2934178 RepID=A0ABD3P1N4_9STRA